MAMDETQPPHAVRQARTRADTGTYASSSPQAGSTASGDDDDDDDDDMDVDVVSSVLVVSCTGSPHSIESLAVCYEHDESKTGRKKLAVRTRLLAGCTDGTLLVFQQKSQRSSVLKQLGEASFDNDDDDDDNDDDGKDLDDSSTDDDRGDDTEVQTKSADDSDDNSMELIQTHTSFAKKPVLQLTAETMSSSGSMSSSSSVNNVSELLISLTDAVNIHTLPQLKLHSSLLKTRGAGAYCWRREDRRLIVACRKKLIMYRWDGFGMMELRELSLSEVPRAIQWSASEAVCVAYKREYCIVSTRSGESKVVCPTGKHGEPSITALPTGELLLLKDSVGIFVDGDGGQPTREHGIAWSATPDDVVLLAWPHAIAIMPKMVEVKALHRRDEQSSGCITFNQTLPLSGCIAVSETQSLSKWSSKKGVRQNGLFVSCASGTQIHRIDVLSVAEQVKNLLDQGELEDAIELANLSPHSDDDDNRSQEMQSLKKSMHLQMADNMMRANDYEKVLSNLQLARLQPNEILSKYSTLMPKLVRDILFMLGSDSVIISSEDSTTETEVDHQRSMQVLLPLLQTYSTNSDDIEGKTLDSAIFAILIFLKDKRLQAFLQSGHRVDNDLCVNVLSNECLYEELIIFHKSKGEYKRSLDLMRKLIAENEVEKQKQSFDDCDGQKYHFDAHYLVEFIKSMSESEVRDHVDSNDWIFVLKHDETVSRQILSLMKLTMSVEDAMALLRIHAPALCLEFMEEVNASNDGEMNVELLQLYIKAALLEKERFIKLGRKDLEWESERSDVRSRLVRMLKRSKAYVSEEILDYFPTDGLYYEKSVIFMREKYHRRALKMLVEDMRHFSTAVSYADEVWNVSIGGTWLEHIGDMRPLEESNAYDDEFDERDIYMMLLEILQESESSELNTKESTISLLNKRFDRIDPTIAFSFVDSSIELEKIRPFLHGVLLTSGEFQRNSAITKGLSRFQNLNTRNKLIALCKTRVVVSSDMSCYHCKRRLGTSAFTVTTDGLMMHFGCYKDSRSGATERELNHEYDDSLLPDEISSLHKQN